MKSIVEADAALIGFLAVVLVFLFSETQSERRRILDRLERLEENHNEYSRLKILEENHGNLIKKEDFEYIRMKDAEKEHRIYKEQQQHLASFAGFYSEFSGLAFSQSIYSVGFFVASILMALFGMSTNSFAQSIGLFASIFAILMGIIIIFNVLSIFKDIRIKYDEPTLG